MFKTYEHCAPCLLGQETCITFFLIRFLMVLSKQQKKKKKEEAAAGPAEPQATELVF